MAGCAGNPDGRLVNKEVNGKVVQILTSMCDPLRYPKADIVDLYSHHWEIEHRFREMKQHLLNNELTLRSKKPERVHQELWGIVLAYNLLRFMMAQMAYSLKGVEPYEMGFKQSAICAATCVYSRALRRGNCPE